MSQKFPPSDIFLLYYTALSVHVLKFNLKETSLSAIAYVGTLKILLLTY